MSGTASGSASGPAGGARDFRIGDRGDLVVPREFLASVGLEPKMRVRFRVDGRTLVIEKAPGGADPFDGPLGKKPDSDLFGKIQRDLEERRARQLGEWGARVEEASKDDSPPPSPFGMD